MADDFSSVFEPPLDQLPDIDDLVRATMEWHFSPLTGSPYWVERAKGFSFDPRTDVQCLADLRLFADVPVDWSQIPAHQLVPRGSAPGVRYGIYESGGATGAPKRIVDATSRRRNVQWQSLLLDEQGFPSGEGNWLHIGPTGPHVMAKNITALSELRGMLCYFVDLDPRWVRRCVGEGRQSEFRRYVDHILDQVKDVLRTQDIRGISTTPRILESIGAREDVFTLLRESVRGIIWGGTSMDGETLRLIDEELFPQAKLAGAYGNTMMGVAPQRTPVPGDKAPCVFRPFYPYTVVELVDPAQTDRITSDDEEGRVVITVLTRDYFTPPTLERDVATRRASADAFPGIELSGVRPYESASTSVVEGVY
ncbi:phenazine biosynthesis protein [Streptomyces melanogenes]|uniref:phenazine biosynthesis protein n=1 Tax=Streptomyces melanogenes TaxID=67326 RepID=UPI00167E449F|nr:phenazine biosynthesis protein [Streptomyces melanogenes]GGP31548.1 phenazine antibiotic biosynthesis protein [Streptomyces melanogenes]